MTTSFEVIPISDAVKRELPGVQDWWDGMDDDWTAGLWRCDDGVPVEFIAMDGGEPEDQSFGRDLAWVPGALKRAHDLGYMRAVALASAPHDGGGGDGKEID